MEDFVPQLNSLIKYSTPVLVSVAGKKPSAKPSHPDTQGSPNKNSKNINSQSKVMGSKNVDQLKTQDILMQNLPPKEYRLKNGQLWIQTVLSTPATKTEVLALQDELEKRLSQRQARETGICPIREELYQQCFDELIRQITIDCSQRGLLLVKYNINMCQVNRVRNEFHNQLDAYKTLYESSIAYGMRKMIDSEQKKTEMQNKIMLLDRECQELGKSVQDLDNRILNTKKVETDKLSRVVQCFIYLKENETHKIDVDKIKQYNNNLKEELQKLLEGRR